MSTANAQQALTIANAERLKRRELGESFTKLGYKGATEEAARILADCHQRYGRMRIDNFLLKIPTVGDHKVDVILRRGAWSINPRRKIGDLTVRERWHIITELGKLPC